MRPNRVQMSSEFFTRPNCALCDLLPSLIHLMDVDVPVA